MADRSRDVERMIFLRREAEKIVRELFQPEGAAAAGGAVRIVADRRTDGDHYVLDVELPGVDLAEVQVSALGEALSSRERRVPACRRRPALPTIARNATTGRSAASSICRDRPTCRR